MEVRALLLQVSQKTLWEKLLSSKNISVVLPQSHTVDILFIVAFFRFSAKEIQEPIWAEYATRNFFSQI
jgi:hypothetical protein